MKFGHAIAVAAATLLSGSVARAQPADLPIPAATTASYPQGVKVGSAGGIPVYADMQGRTLYGMDMRVLLRAGADPSQYCRDACAQLWEPLLAPADSKPNIMFPAGFGDRRGAPRTPAQGSAAAADPEVQMIQNQKAPDWTIIAGSQGPQWVYKGWHMVYVHKGDKPGAATYEGADNMTWNTLKYVPPVPKVAAPLNVATAFIDGSYALVDKDGRLLFTGSCSQDCAGWRPFSGPMASSGLGEWVVSRDTDSPQWLYRGKPVFVAQGPGIGDLPPGAAVLRP